MGQMSRVLFSLEISIYLHERKYKLKEACDTVDAIFSIVNIFKMLKYVLKIFYKSPCLHS